MRTAATFVALPVSAGLIWALLHSALGRRLRRAPAGDRWLTAPTPLVGGTGIFGGLLAGVLAAVAVDAIDASPELVAILLGAGVLYLAGLVDDVRSLPPLAKLGAQLAAAAIALAGGLQVEVVGNDVLAVALALVWLVGMTNAFNLLDNMDGLAATLAGIACFWFAIDAYFYDTTILALVFSLSLGLACAGFLPFNVRPGRPAAAFMGDSGSQVLGFTLAALGLYSSYNAAGTTIATLLVPVLVLAVPILDTALVSVVRLLEGRPIHQGGRDHTSHRLVYQGLSERRALLLLSVIAFALGATSLAYNVVDNGRIALLGVLLTFAALVQFASFLGDIEREQRLPPERGPWLVRTFVVHRRRLVEVTVDFALICSSFLAAYLILVGGSGTEYQRHMFMVALPAVLFARYTCFIPFGLYRGVWRYAGARDAAAVVAAVAISAVLAYAFVALTNEWGDFPRSVFVVDALLCVLLVGSSRFGERALDSLLESLRQRGSRRRTLIVGAGRGGRSLLRELRETPGQQVVGFVDDDPRLLRRRLQGVAVIGPTADAAAVLARTRPDVVLVTIPDAPRDRLDPVVAACEAAGIPCRFVRRELDLDPDAVLAAVE
jgi:UDP-GlcNAc:undecaprenyl-phosphate GlcNAc-1-phosphate transferase